MKVSLNRKYCGQIGDKQVLDFIENFLAHQNKDEAEPILKDQFNAGYCYYFAVILKAAFNRGQICWCAPYGHMCWLDTDGIPYDIYGICISEADYYIPVEYLGPCIQDFLHIGNPHCTTSTEMQEIINKYLDDNNGQIINTIFTSYWDEGYAITSKCKVNLKTHEVFDIEKVDVDGFTDFQGQQIEINNILYDVVQEDELDEKDKTNPDIYWYY